MGDRVSLAAPFLAPESVVRDEWLDANGHMNLAYYVVVFDHATDALLEAIDLGDDYRRRDGGAVFAVETHTLYRHELRAGERVRVATRLLGADAKRLHLAHEMLHPAHGRVAMQELMFLHVDVATRRAAAFPPDAAARLAEAVAAHASLPRPDWVGRRIALPA
jgi:acyl-CoA thioester hydrolase